MSSSCSFVKVPAEELRIDLSFLYIKYSIATLTS